MNELAHIVSIFAILAWIIERVCRRRAEKDRNGWQEFALEKCATSQFSDCHLIDIQRNGRSNYFTFSRNDQTFTIETMGLLSDDLTLWRKQAGLDK